MTGRSPDEPKHTYIPRHPGDLPSGEDIFTHCEHQRYPYQRLEVQVNRPQSAQQ